jgi:2-C-methyl-D-erythritol 4-phosphate cytidylyltransferase
MKSDQPKQFLPIGGRPVLMHTLERFHQWDAEADLIVVLPPEHRTYWRMLCESYNCTIPHRTVAGGETRFHSVRNGLRLVNVPSLVGVHDAVRPFVAPEVIDACFAEAEHYGAAVPVMPIVETMRVKIPGEWKSRSVDRNHYLTVQTPQVFWAGLLQKAYRQSYQAEFTDDASVVEAMGIQIRSVTGNCENMKLTSPFDWQLAEAIFHLSCP